LTYLVGDCKVGFGEIRTDESDSKQFEDRIVSGETVLIGKSTKGF
jgi:hypothetical protein